MFNSAGVWQGERETFGFYPDRSRPLVGCCYEVAETPEGYVWRSGYCSVVSGGGSPMGRENAVPERESALNAAINELGESLCRSLEYCQRFGGAAIEQARLKKMLGWLVAQADARKVLQGSLFGEGEDV